MYLTCHSGKAWNSPSFATFSPASNLRRLTTSTLTPLFMCRIGSASCFRGYNHGFMLAKPQRRYKAFNATKPNEWFRLLLGIQTMQKLPCLLQEEAQIIRRMLLSTSGNARIPWVNMLSDLDLRNGNFTEAVVCSGGATLDANTWEAGDWFPAGFRDNQHTYRFSVTLACPSSSCATSFPLYSTYFPPTNVPLLFFLFAIACWFSCSTTTLTWTCNDIFTRLLRIIYQIIYQKSRYRHKLLWNILEHTHCVPKPFTLCSLDTGSLPELPYLFWNVSVHMYSNRECRNLELQLNCNTQILTCCLISLTHNTRIYFVVPNIMQWGIFASQSSPFKGESFFIPPSKIIRETDRIGSKSSSLLEWKQQISGSDLSYSSSWISFLWTDI